jgi:hypothetical protein
MDIGQLRRLIQKRHKNGESFRIIAASYGITKPMACQIFHGYKPGKRVSAILNLDPDPDLKYTRSRRDRLDEIASGWGYVNWCAYETAMLHCPIPNPTMWINSSLSVDAT